MSNASQFSASSIAAQQGILRERLHRLVATLHPLLQNDVVHALKGAGKLLSQPDTEIGALAPVLPAGMWSLLTLLIAHHLSPDIHPEYASSVAVAVECFVCALDLLDDVEDEDQTPIVRSIGIPRVLNASTALLTLSYQAILSLSEQAIEPAIIIRLLNTLQECALTATSGQHRDLLAESRSAGDFSHEECIEIASGKAGSIMRLACRLGAICGGADDTLCEQFSELGKLLGIAHQLDNDCHDLYYLLQDEKDAVIVEATDTTRTSIKSDLKRGKKTLPVVLAAEISTSLQKAAENSDGESRRQSKALQEGIITTWGICLLYRERARERLQEIEVQKPVSPALHFLLGI
ncbi:MAG TPA: polyprenyl synthetase family protein [Ktedonobacteraceae bacterium]|nr:polyprenyl synthetase family protein [Ktedonobacteraceae bacterium]